MPGANYILQFGRAVLWRFDSIHPLHLSFSDRLSPLPAASGPKAPRVTLTCWLRSLKWSSACVIQEGHRAVQKTVQTVCTFGYGISRRGARNILKVLGPGQEEAFDVAMMKQCQTGSLHCISVNPELFHHYNPKDGTGYISPNREANGSGQSSEEDTFENLVGTTANMKHSARCAALFNARCPQPPTDPNAYR